MATLAAALIAALPQVRAQVPAAGAQVPAAGAQGPAAGIPGLDLGQGGDSGPVEITATNGIEWDRARNRYIASGDAKATRGDTSAAAAAAAGK